VDLNLLKTFVAIVEAGSMTQAARRLKQPVSRVSRALARLERDLSLRLILRTTRSFQATEAGRRLFREAQPMIRQIEGLGRALSQESDELAGLVRITAPEDFGQALLAPLIAELGALQPALEFDLNLTDDYVDLVRTETDIGIRAGRLRDSSLKAKRLGTSRFEFVASPRYLDARGAPRRPAELREHRCIYALADPSRPQSSWDLVNNGRVERVQLSAWCRVNHKGTALALARAGAGIALVPVSMLPEYLRAGELARALEGWSLEPVPVHLVYPPQRVVSRKVREVSRFLEERLRPIFKA
jgi:DNA-binding transcriptional LysR family regulator